MEIHNMEIVWGLMEVEWSLIFYNKYFRILSIFRGMQNG